MTKFSLLETMSELSDLQITLSGTLEFTTRDCETFVLRPGEVLLAADTTGTGHRWRIIDDQPWRRLYVELRLTT
jgi:hypothetical protein